jgi:ubiquinone/menaquinone biosynthesis C-methylase UbiE
MSETTNPIIETYSRLATDYDDGKNLESCWGIAARKALPQIQLEDRYRVVLDMGCGTGRSVVELARRNPVTSFVGVEPAANMRELAAALAQDLDNVHVSDGRFEEIPMESNSVDYIYSVMAFHWTTDLNRSVDELARVLRPDGEMDLIFIGRKNGREFIKQTTPIFLRYMGPSLLLESASMRKQLSLEQAMELFSRRFSPSELRVDESFDTYYDTLDGHWGWWVRIEGQFFKMPDDRKEACENDVQHALAELQTEQGIPYTIHSLHVRLRR